MYREYHEFLGRIPGITIFKRCDSYTDRRECYSFTFGHHDWCKTVDVQKTFFAHPNEVLNFLQSKGYVISKKRSKGQVVVYHTATTTHHFAKVTQVEPDGKVLVTSKFASYHIYTHAVGHVPYLYGNSVTFLSPPN